MPETKLREEDLLRLLRYIDPITGEGARTNPVGIQVAGFRTFQDALAYDERQFDLFQLSLFLSLNQVEDRGQREEASAVLRETINALREIRVKRNRLNALPRVATHSTLGSTSGPRITEVLGEMFSDTTTSIGPVILDHSTPVTEVFVSEDYDASLLKTVRGVSDPVLRSHKNRIVMTMTVEFPAETINDKFRRLIATLRVAPVCEIRSDAIIPVFVNTIASPELFQRVRDEAFARLPNADKLTLRQEAEKIASGLLSNVPAAERLKAPPGSPKLSELEQMTVVATPGDGGDDDADSFWLSGIGAVRLLGVDAHESDTAAGASGTAFRKSIAGVGTTVWVERAIDDAVDDFGRDLVYVYLADGTQLNLRLIQEGHIKRLFTRVPNTKYSHAYEEAFRGFAYPGLANFARRLAEFDQTLLPAVMKEIANRAISSDAPPDFSAIPVSAEASGSSRETRQSVAVAAAFVGCVVRTTPGKTGSITCKLTFTKFNDKALQNGKVLYRDRNGNRTTDVFQCPWIDRLAEHCYLTPQAGDETASVHYMKPYQPPGDRESLFQLSWEDPLSETLQRYESDPELCVVEEVIVQSNLKMVSVPLAGQVYSIAQYMGAENMVVTLKLLVKDRLELAKLHEAKAELDKINYDAGILYRFGSARVENGIINLMGGRDFVITKVDTGIDSSLNASRVSIQMVESRLSAVDTEAITVLNQEKKLREDAKRVWDYLYEVLSQRVDTSDDQSPFITLEDANQFGPQFRNDFKLAYDLIFGRDASGQSTHLNPNALAATYYSLAMRDKFVKGYRWDTSRQNDSVMGSIFSGEADPRGVFVGAEDPLTMFELASSFHSGITHRLATYSRTGKSWPQGGRNAIEENGEELIGFIGGPARPGVFLTKRAWDEYFSVVMDKGRADSFREAPAWTNADLERARSSLYALVSTGIFLRFQGLNVADFDFAGHPPNETAVSLSQDQVERGGRLLSRTSNFADVRLPSYAEMFRQSVGELAAVTDGSTGQATLPLWKKFAPTYADLGKPAPFDLFLAFQDYREVGELVARRLNDPVEPDFFYWFERTKYRSEEVELERQDQLIQALAYVNANVLSVSAGDTGTALSSFRDVIKQLMDSPARVRDPRLQDQRSNRELVEKQRVVTMVKDGIVALAMKPEPGASSSQVQVVHAGKTTIRGADGTPIVLNPLEPDYLRKNTQRFLETLPDRTLSMQKLFPAYRLYFIEEDRNQAYFVDDLYGVNCVVGMSLRKSKDDADLLTVQLSNVTDNLGTEQLLSDAVAENLGLSPDDEGEQFFNKLKVQPGVSVQLRLGYGGSPDDLDVVFTGMVTEVQPGKLLTIVAQGHKRELMNEVQFVDGSANYFDIVQDIVERCEHPHLGVRTGIAALSDAAVQDALGPSANARDHFDRLDEIFNKKVDTVTQNVYIEGGVALDRHSFLKALGLQSESDSRSRVGFTLVPSWVCPPQPAWDALKEVTRHQPGHIIDVVPKGTQATLFIGRPDQPYRAEAPPPLQKFLYDKASSLITHREEFNVLDELVNPFLVPGNPRLALYRSALSSVDGRTRDLYERATFGSRRDRASNSHVQRDLDLVRRLKGVDDVSVEHIGGAFGEFVRLRDSDLTSDWEKLGSYHPDAQRLLFQWFYELDDQAVSRTAVATSWAFISPLFLEPQSKPYRDLSDALKDERIFSAPVGALRKTRLALGADALVLEKEAIRKRVASGLVSEQEAAEAMTRLEAELGRTGPTLPNPEIIATDPDESLASLFGRTGSVFKFFVHQLVEDIKARDTDSKTKLNVERLRSSLGNLRAASLPPGWKVFRNYHRLGFRDIIENNIVATMAEMGNCVLVRAPESKIIRTVFNQAIAYKSNSATGQNGDRTTDVIVDYDECDWISFPTNDGLAFNEKLARKNRKLIVVPELNALENWQKSNCLMTDMAEVLRPMYRGSLLVTGRHIKPYDVVYIDDQDKDLVGFFEVASVIHHFTSDMGWVTEIEPHALLNINNPTGRIQISTFQQILDEIEPGLDFLDSALTVLAIAGVIAAPFTGGGSLAGTAAATGVRAAVVRGLASLGRGAARAAGRVAGSASAASVASGASAASASVTKSLMRMKTKRVLDWIGRHYGKVFGTTLVLRGGRSLGRLYTQVELRHQISNFVLPVTMTPLVYQGNAFTAGLEADNDDLYSLDDTLGEFFRETRRDVSDALYQVGRQVFRGETLSPTDKFLGGD